MMTVRQDISPVDTPRVFGIDEMIFSMTDGAGLIKSCNDVFCRIPDYESQDILGKPQSIIRHPDMPRCLFELVWRHLNEGRSVGAYIKNLAATGEYYWVFALMVPVDGGFLSIGLKPSGPMLSVLESLYAKVLGIEESHSDDHAEGMRLSGEALIEGIRAAGFETYDDFMVQTLNQEVISRRTAMLHEQASQRQTKPAPDDISALFDLSGRLGTTSDFFEDLAIEIRRVAINASIVAARLQERGNALSVISEEVSRVAEDIDEESGKLRTQVAELRDLLFATSFNASFRGLLTDTSAAFSADVNASGKTAMEQAASYGLTLEQISLLLEKSANTAKITHNTSYTAMRLTLSRFDRFIDALARVLMTLQFGYVTGKSVSVAIEDGQEFSVLLEDLVGYSSAARATLDSTRASVRNVPADSGTAMLH